MTRVVAIGLDAVDHDVVTQLRRARKLPNLTRLAATGATVDLVADVDYRAEWPWDEFVTGRAASSLRYWSTVTFSPYDYAAFMRGAPDAEPFFAMGDDTTVVAFDVPKVIRSPNVAGVQILGWGAHSPQYPLGSTPEGELEAVRARFGRHPGVPIEYHGEWHQPEYLTRFAAAQSAGIGTRAEILRWLASRTPAWNLLLTLVGETHQLGHMTAHGFGGRLAHAPSATTARQAMTTVLEAADALVGDVLAWVARDTTVVVFSVQGMEPADYETTAILVPEILLRATIGESRLPDVDLAPWRRGGCAPVIPAEWDSPLGWTSRRFRGHRREATRTAARRRARAAAAAHAPAALDAWRRLRDHVVDHHEPDPDLRIPTTHPARDESMNTWHLSTWYRDAWPRMPAFVIPGFSDAQIRINLAGRERDGIVERDDYTRACDQVEAVLRGCRNAATGAPVVREVHRVRADDPYAPDGPPADLVVHLEGADAVEHPSAGAVGPMVAPRTGAHTRHGFAYLAGPGITAGARGTFPVCDLPATIAALLEAHPVTRLDGHPFLEGPATDSLSPG